MNSGGEMGVSSGLGNQAGKGGTREGGAPKAGGTCGQGFEEQG